MRPEIINSIRNIWLYKIQPMKSRMAFHFSKSNCGDIYIYTSRMHNLFIHLVIWLQMSEYRINRITKPNRPAYRASFFSFSRIVFIKPLAWWIKLNPKWFSCDSDVTWMAMAACFPIQDNVRNLFFIKLAMWETDCILRGSNCA